MTTTRAVTAAAGLTAAFLAGPAAAAPCPQLRDPAGDVHGDTFGTRQPATDLVGVALGAEAGGTRVRVGVRSLAGEPPGTGRAHEYRVRFSTPRGEYVLDIALSQVQPRFWLHVPGRGAAALPVQLRGAVDDERHSLVVRLPHDAETALAAGTDVHGLGAETADAVDLGGLRMGAPPFHTVTDSASAAVRYELGSRGCR